MLQKLVIEFRGVFQIKHGFHTERLSLVKDLSPNFWAIDPLRVPNLCNHLVKRISIIALLNVFDLCLRDDAVLALKLHRGSFLLFKIWEMASNCLVSSHEVEL